MLMVAFTSALLLTIVYHTTKGPIQKAQDKMIAESIIKVISTPYDNDPFAEKIEIRQGRNLFALYPARLDGYVTSIIMKSKSTKGFGGDIDILVGFLMDGSISGYKVVKHKETPGLGSKVDEDTFKKNIIGKNPADPLFKVKQDGGEVDAVTGATISSRAIIDAVKKAYKGYLKFNAVKIDE